MSDEPPSFSSFPPSFSSFPEVEDPSSSTNKPSKEVQSSKERTREGRSRHPETNEDGTSKGSKHDDDRRGSDKPRKSKHRSAGRSHGATDGRLHRVPSTSESSQKRDTANNRDSREMSAADLFIQEALTGVQHSSNTKSRKNDENSLAGSQGLYVEDRRGDQSNLRYEGLHAHAVPKYKRMGCKYQYFRSTYTLLD